MTTKTALIFVGQVRIFNDKQLDIISNTYNISSNTDIFMILNNSMDKKNIYMNNKQNTINSFKKYFGTKLKTILFIDDIDNYDTVQKFVNNSIRINQNDYTEIINKQNFDSNKNTTHIKKIISNKKDLANSNKQRLNSINPINNNFFNLYNNSNNDYTTATLIKSGMRKTLDKNKIVSNNPLIKKDFTEHLIHTCIQWIQLYFGIIEVEKYEEANNFNYDFIIKGRFDIAFDDIATKFHPQIYLDNKTDLLFRNFKHLFDKNKSNNEIRKSLNTMGFCVSGFNPCLGGAFLKKNEGYDNIISIIRTNPKLINKEIIDKYIIMYNDFMFFGSATNMKIVAKKLVNEYGKYWSDNLTDSFTPEGQLHITIKNNKMFALDYYYGKFYKFT
jgi:hypothetical protein